MAAKNTNNNTNLTEEQIKKIESYSNDISHIEGFINQCRARPGMYLGPLQARGLLSMFREVFQNSVDQLIMKTSPCDMISVTYDERDNRFIVSDNGLGLPYDKMFDILTREHTGKNIKAKKLYEYSAGIN